MTTESTALTVVQRAIVALGYNDETRKGLNALADESKHITAITNAAGREQAHAAMMKLKNTRVAIEKRGKEARDDATKFSKAVIAEEGELIALISVEETRLQALRDGWDDAIEAEKQAKIRAEQERAQAIQRRIDDMRPTVLLCATSHPDVIGDHIAALEAVVIDESFGDRQEQAQIAKDAGLAKLLELHAAAIAHSAECARLAAEREELAHQRAQQEARDIIERERIAAEEAEAKRKRDEAAAIEAARMRAERETFEAEQTAERERQAAEQRRIDAEFAELQRQQREAREAEEARSRKEREDSEAKARAEREASELAARKSAETKSAFGALRAMIEHDPEYAWSWHCNVAVPILDSNVGLTREQANIAAARVMDHLFGVDITLNAHWDFQRAA